MDSRKLELCEPEQIREIKIIVLKHKKLSVDTRNIGFLTILFLRCIQSCSQLSTLYQMTDRYCSLQQLLVLIQEAQSKEGILLVATLSIALYASSKSRSRRDVAPEVSNFVIGIINSDKQRQLPRATGLTQASNAFQQNEIPILGRAKRQYSLNLFYTNTSSHPKHQ